MFPFTPSWFAKEPIQSPPAFPWMSLHERTGAAVVAIPSPAALNAMIVAWMRGEDSV